MQPFLEFRNISMQFPGVKALDSVGFTVNRGEVVAFVGENGAGKSTLLKILNGDYQPTSGEIYMMGKRVCYANPDEAIKAGISVIYQERQLAQYLSVAENIFLGRIPTQHGFINYKLLNAKAQAIIDEFGLPLSPTVHVKNISVAYQQMVEIMKAYAREADIYCFDEPTAPLTESEIKVLFEIIRKLKNQGKAIIYISHRLSEMFQITDRAIILKDGKFVAERCTAQTNESELVSLMVGRDIGDSFLHLNRNQNMGETVLELSGVTTDRLKDISLTVRAGEIVGLSGLAGAGRTEIARAIFGADKIKKGSMKLCGRPYTPRSPKHAMRMGVALAPEDRKLEGLSLMQCVRENVTLAVVPQYTVAGFINFKRDRSLAKQLIQEFNIKTPSSEQTVINLSGGNQQKIILARWMAMEPKLIIFDEPTKGIDVGAKSEIYRMICSIAHRGIAVLFISSELPEVIGLSDRIIVLKDGQVTADIQQKDATERGILSYAMLDHTKTEGTY